MLIPLLFLTSAQSSARESYPDGRPSAHFRMEARDQGVVMKHGNGPAGCDKLGARDVWVFKSGKTFYLHYDGAPKGMAVLFGHQPGPHSLGKKRSGAGFRKGRRTRLRFRLLRNDLLRCVRNGACSISALPIPPQRRTSFPAFPYQTLMALGKWPSGPWVKQPNAIPFRCKSNTYYSVTASPGQIDNPERNTTCPYAASEDGHGTHRTIGIARTLNLDAAWKLDPHPIVPAAEQVENTSSIGNQRMEHGSCLPTILG